MIITSQSNQKIKEVLKLKDIKHIKKNKKYLIDGLHLVEEAIKKSVVEELFIVESFDKEIKVSLDNIPLTYISERVAKELSDTVNNQGIFAVCSINTKNLEISNYKSVVILDRIQDPGNLGTIVRTADAFGFDCVILGKGTTSLYSQKVIRSMQGSNFHIDCYDNVDLELLFDELKDYDILATSLQGSKNLEEITTVSDKVALVLGNEAKGVDDKLLAKVTTPVKIKMAGEAESLNVAVSSGILMHYVKNVLK